MTPENAPWATDDAIDLLSKMLVMDPVDRVAAKDALEHPYFDMIKPDPNVFKEDRNIQVEEENHKKDEL